MGAMIYGVKPSGEWRPSVGSEYPFEADRWRMKLWRLASGDRYRVDMLTQTVFHIMDTARIHWWECWDMDKGRIP